MADSALRIEVRHLMDSAIPKDASINVWSFKKFVSGVPLTDAATAIGRLESFYTGIEEHYSSRVDTTVRKYRVFNLADAQPRVPILESDQTWASSTSANVDLPPEVAICLSFRATAASGLNARRRRGRVYIGPLQTTSTADYDKVLTATADDIALSAKTALLDTQDDLTWCVYSPYTHHGVPVGRNINEEDENGDKVFPEVPANLEASFATVTTLWCDNAYDTQRRRGVEASYRRTYSA